MVPSKASLPLASRWIHLWVLVRTSQEKAESENPALYPQNFRPRLSVALHTRAAYPPQGPGLRSEACCPNSPWVDQAFVRPDQTSLPFLTHCIFMPFLPMFIENHTVPPGLGYCAPSFLDLPGWLPSLSCASPPSCWPWVPGPLFPPWARNAQLPRAESARCGLWPNIISLSGLLLTTKYCFDLWF